MNPRQDIRITPGAIVRIAGHRHLMIAVEDVHDNGVRGRIWLEGAFKGLRWDQLGSYVGHVED